MDFSLVFYETQHGRCPVREFLDELKTVNPDDFAIIMAGLAKLGQRQNHRPPLSKPINDGLFELRHTGKLNTRVFYFFMKGKRIILVHAIRNKAQKIPTRDREIAQKRMQDWLKREA
jgi:phage-related protein